MIGSDLARTFERVTPDEQKKIQALVKDPSVRAEVPTGRRQLLPSQKTPIVVVIYQRQKQSWAWASIPI